jgi:hypothetical protein
MKRISSWYSPLKSICVLVKNHLTIYARVYFCDLYFILSVCMSIITPAPHCIAYCKFAVSFTIKMCESYFFVLLSNIVLVIKITSPRILGLAFLFLQKKKDVWDCDRGWIECEDHFGSIAILMTLSLPTHEYLFLPFISFSNAFYLQYSVVSPWLNFSNYFNAMGKIFLQYFLILIFELFIAIL